MPVGYAIHKFLDSRLILCIVGKIRLQGIEKELEAARTRQLETEKELGVERAKRREMEAVLKDVERERKSPFVVPALLEAFIKISQVTTSAIQYKAASGADA